MSQIREYVSELLGEMFAWIVGMVFCIAMLVGAFSIGLWLAPYLGWTRSPDTLGLLTAFAFVWLYEHRDIEEKYKRLRAAQE